MIDPIRNHRSIRKFKETPLDQAQLEEILLAGTRASTTGNMQLYSMVVNQDAAMREKLWPLHFKQELAKQAPVIITFCADINRFHKWCEHRDAAPAYDNFLWYLNAATDALLASQNVALEAEAKGLGICYLGTTLYMAEPIIELLELPKGVIPVTTIALGHPGQNPPLTDRLPLKGVVHHETYNDYTAEDIDRIYAEKEALEETQQLLKENNKATLAQIFTDNRYKKADNLQFSRNYLKLLEKQGFMNNEQAPEK